MKETWDHIPDDYFYKSHELYEKLNKMDDIVLSQVRNAYVSSSKGNTGHLLCASGSIETVFAAKMMKE